MNDFCAYIADILGTTTVTENDKLADYPEWDSLSVLSVIAMLDSKYSVNVTAADLKCVRTVADLWNLAQANKKA